MKFLLLLLLLSTSCKSTKTYDESSTVAASGSNRSAIVDSEKMLSDPELGSFARSFVGNGSSKMIDYRSSKKVIVYRAIGGIRDLKELNLNANYSDRLNYYGEDFVTHDLGWATHYGTYRRPANQGVLIKYELPANILAPDMSMRKQEPYYVISRKKLAAASISDVAEFVIAVARINSNQDDNQTHSISDEKDRRLEWVNAKTLAAMKKFSH